MKRLRILTFLVCLIPFVLLLLKVLQNDLGPDPAKELALETGEWSIRFLLLALAMTPLRHLSGRMEFAQRRRMVGLFALFYASVHFLVWVIFLLGLRWGAILEEVVERPYITIGFSSFLILIVLGATSPRVMVRKLGKNWRRLHRLVYVAGVLAIIHLVWIVRTDLSEALLYGAILAGLLGWRLVFARNKARGLL
ncbi:sulfoxide reductase heme-binding subunit YedZ [Gammaproteobacteria bacterium]|jgi:sulfoxide reductase heme-binding subunit YedZ|nr:sulfoxide reductase heme-binding subunit YedZ [Gammaproteobacteria bacterium]MDA7781891.1 sulfoxide reductase heme-binding subunit YedZ [Gammaproteobacteria bacterium]MDA8602493.1 sulfoxide reductase heme-binding subunit YedZ [Gammaproteobacteria bacterium]MDA8795419.1 sulfoxide reductase heme-binding subunit YedZ [Gammaproteobacteria bacterium]MDA8928273.1 sulfoxide reductase heme-binding subunit YedZ [Gammaproteobacteria bacterium]